MRVISGKLGGRTFEAPQSDQLRPTNDRVRSAMFSMLENLLDFDGTLVADLFAGSGGLGIEALSRGAGHVTFIERDVTICGALKKNLRKLELLSDAKVINRSVPEALSELRGAECDLVFADPPYALDCGALLAEVVKNRILKSGGLFVFESGKRSASIDIEGLSVSLLKDKAYGDSVVRVYKFE